MLPQFVFRKTIYIINVLSLFIVWTTIYIADLYFHLFCGAPFTLRICCLHLLSERPLIITDLLSSFVVLDRHFHCRFFAFIYCPNIVDLFCFFFICCPSSHWQWAIVIFICCFGPPFTFQIYYLHLLPGLLFKGSGWARFWLKSVLFRKQISENE